MTRTLYTSLCFAILVAVLTACGGGDPEPEDRSFVGPPDCANRPDLCK